MYKISDITKRNLERSLGISLNDFTKLSADEERIWIEKKTGKKLQFSKRKKHGIVGRGNPLLARRKIRTIKDLEYKSKNLYGI